MTFTRRLRDGVRHGEITCSVRVRTRPHVAGFPRGCRSPQGRNRASGLPAIATDCLSQFWKAEAVGFSQAPKRYTEKSRKL